MKFCKHCVYPEIKPDLSFDENGVCSACNNFAERRDIDWEKRENEFIKLVDKVQKRKYPYDCIIPVSGGKDSHYQVITAKRYGLNALAVTATTDDLSSLGRANLNNIGRLGVDHIEITTNSKIRRRINNYTLNRIGDISWAEHVTIFTVPFREAAIRNIPLIIYGENPQNEYGGPEADKPYMKSSWLQEFGGLNGLRISDLLEAGIAHGDELLQYTMPTIQIGRKMTPLEEIANLPQAIFLGYYFPWDGKANAEIAKQHGFKTYKWDVEGTGVNYENLDNHQTGIHDYFKWLKFGFGRATDIACNLIRRGQMTREEGKEFVYLYDGRFPNTYLGKSLENILREIDMTIDDFMIICDKFTNPTIFEPRVEDNPRPKLKHRIMEI